MKCAHFTCHQCAASGYTFRGGYIEDEAGDRWWSQELLAKVEQERDEARAEVAELRRKLASTQAELDCAKAFHDVAVKERDLARLKAQP